MSQSLLQPVAILRTPFAEKFGVPRQSGLVPAAEGRVEFLPAFSAPEFVRGLEAFSHVWLITGFHQNPSWTGSAVVRPPRLGGNDRVGVFASRSPNRPNGLGLSLVKVIAIEPGVIRVAGIDAVDGTPVFDLKPYLPWCESVPNATADWASVAPPAGDPAKILLPDEHAKRMGAATAELVRQLLRLNLEPAYQDATTRTYGMTLAGWNIRWRRAADGSLEVTAVDPA
jgi:tRNA-Thr(GGU) m(6)t(6)A37 methyltransferase TsaA